MKKILALAAGLLVSACAVDVQPGVYGSSYVLPAPIYVPRPVYVPPPVYYAPRPIYRPYYYRPYYYRRHY